MIKCSKCGELGKRADGCGRTHNVSPAPAKGVEVASRSGPTSPKRSRDVDAPAPANFERLAVEPPRTRDRIASIAASQQRVVARVARPQRARSRIDPDEPTPFVAELPVPTATFVF